MRKKLCVLVLLLLMACVFLCACQKTPPAPPVVINSPGGSYEVVGVSMEPVYSGLAAPVGSSYLLITLQGGKADMDDMESTFLEPDQPPCKVSAGSFDVECSKVAYGTMTAGDNPDVLATLVFLVPSDFPNSFTLSANNADPVALEYTPREEKK